MQLGLSGELGKLVNARLTEGRSKAKSGGKRPGPSVVRCKADVIEKQWRNFDSEETYGYAIRQ